MTIEIADYDSRWPEMFLHEASKVRKALGLRALRVEHTGSTSVVSLAAKPIIDITLVVADSSDEAAYAPALENAGYVLKIREPEWHEHRMFKGTGIDVNLHVFSDQCAEVERILLFRDWLRVNAADRELYEKTKRTLAGAQWSSVQDYADAKTAVIEEILRRAASASSPNDPR